MSYVENKGDHFWNKTMYVNAELQFIGVNKVSQDSVLNGYYVEILK